MEQYLSLLRHILANGGKKTDRTGTGTLSVFGHQMRFNLTEGFPLVTTKKIHLRSVVLELLWFLRGDTNVRYLQEHGVRIWDQWADENGELGPIYGKQWRSWPVYVHHMTNWHGAEQHIITEKIDQISNVIKEIRANPDSRRLIVSSWNVGELEKMRLPPCHLLFQFYVAEGRLSCQLYQRSCDMFLGVPFNIASYSLLTMMVAKVCGLGLGEFIWTGGDVHLYTNHLEQAKLQLSRTPRPLPRVTLNPQVKDIFAFTLEDVALEGYDPHPHIKADVAV